MWLLILFSLIIIWWGVGFILAVYFYGLGLSHYEGVVTVGDIPLCLFMGILGPGLIPLYFLTVYEETVIYKAKKKSDGGDTSWM